MPLPVNDVDTDQIIPAQFLKVTEKNGLADALFYHWRNNMTLFVMFRSSPDMVRRKMR